MTATTLWRLACLFCMLFPGLANALAPTLDLDYDNSSGYTGYNYRALNYTEDGTRVRVADTDSRITDPDSTYMYAASFQVYSPEIGDRLTTCAGIPSGIAYNKSLSSPGAPNYLYVYTGQASKSTYQNLLESVCFYTASDTPSTNFRYVDVRVSDSSKYATFSNTARATFDVFTNNDPPDLDLDADNSSGATGGDFQQAFIIGTGETQAGITDADRLVADVDSAQLTRTVINLTNPQAGDRLVEIAALPAGITLDAASTDSQRIYTGSASPATYQTLLGIVRFSNFLGDPGTATRSIETTITDDGSLTTAAITSIVFTHAPRIDLDGNDDSGATDGGYQTTFLVGNSSSVAIADTDAVITDSDSALLSGVTAALINAQGSDSLIVTGPLPGGIVADTDTPGTVVLSGAASLADYTAALKLISFNTGTTPLPDTRLVAVTTTDDQGNTTNIVTTRIDMGGGLSVSLEGSPYLVLSGNNLRYTATVMNNGLTAIGGVTLTAILPPGPGTFQGFSGDQLADWDCNIFDYTAICTYLPVLASGAGASMSFDIVTPDDTGTIFGQFTVGSNALDPYADDNTATQQSVVVNYDTGGFVPDVRLFDENAVDNDHAGFAVAIDGEFLAVGIPDYGINDEGAVQVWKKQNNSWINGTVLQAAIPVSDARFGGAVAIDGTTLVVGAPSYYDGGSVYVFERDGNNWVQTQRIEPGDGFAADWFGAAITLQGDTLVIGAPEVIGTGQVYVYKRTGSGFVEALKLDPQVSTPRRFGASVSLDQGTLVVGAPAYEGLMVDYPGQAFVYSDNNGAWTLQQELTHNNSRDLDYFGRAVAIDGDLVVVGAQYNADAGYRSGSAHVYRRNGLAWSYQQQLTALDAVYSEEFGSSFAIQGETIVVGAPAARTAEAFGDQSGAAYVFQLVGATWEQQQKRSYTDYILDPPREAVFGTAVALDGSTLVIGMPRLSSRLPGTPVTEHGLALVTSVNLDPAIKLTPATTHGHFGRSIAISGDTLMIGAPREEQAGVVYFYTRTGTTWALQQRVTGMSLGVYTAPDYYSEFGAAVEIEGDRAVVGAPFDNQGATANGAVYVLSRSYELPPYDGSWSLQQQLVASGAETDDDRFGFSVDLVGETILVGAPGDEDATYNVSEGGSSYIFEYNGSNWNQTQQLYPSLGFPGGLFGYAVALRADALVIGSPFPGAVSGLAFVFTRGAGWTESLVLEPPTAPGEYGNFGSSVAISDYVLLVGAPEMSVDGKSDSGMAYVFVNQWGSWIYSSEFNYGEGVNPDASQQFGFAVATDGETEIASAPYYDQGTDNNTGAIYATDRYPDYQVTAEDSQDGDSYGYALAINHEAMVVGAPFEDGNVLNSDTGKVYVYPRFTTISMPGGTYNSAQLVELVCQTCSSPTHEVWYTRDGSDPVAGGASSMLYTGDFLIDATTTLKYASFDGSGVLRESIATDEFIIDGAAPSVAIASPYDGETVTEQSPEAVTLNGIATDPAGGADIFQVQVQVRDVTDPQNEVVITGSLWQPAALTYNQSASAWEWSLLLDDANTSQVLVSEHAYVVEARTFDAVGNVSPVVTSQFTYYTGTASFMTLDLNLSASSILNVPGDDPGGEGELDASVKLTDPGDLGADLSSSAVTLTITDPHDVVTNLPLMTNINGQQTLQDLGDGSLIDFDVEGTWTVQAHFAGTLTRDPADSAALTLLVGQSAGTAVIVVGRLGSPYEGLASHNKTGKRIYDVLINRGFQPQDIEFYSPDTNRDGIIDGLDGVNCADGDGCNDVSGEPNGIDAVPGRANVQAAIEGMATKSNTNPAPRYLFFVDHGNVDQFLLNDTETITPFDLDLWLDTQEGLLTGDALNKPNVVVLGMCYSGSFLDTVAVDDTNNPSPVDRVLAASAAPNEESYKGSEESDGIRVGEFFLEEYVKEMGRGATLRAAFEYATRQTEIFTRKSDIALPDAEFTDVAAQHPLLEDNRAFDPLDLAGNNLLGSAANADGALADTLYLGVGPTYATNAVNNPADITAVTSTVFLAAGDNTSLLTLVANDDTRVASAWVEVRAPATQLLPSHGTIQLDPVLSKDILNPPIPGVLESWYTTYSNFGLDGKYEVFYLVEDAATGEISPIRRSVVYRNTAGNNNPAEPTLLLPVDTATTDNAILFDWAASIDPDFDPVTYTLEISTDNSFATVAYREEEIIPTYTFVGEGAGLQDQTIYYWRVIAVDAFGGKGISGAFSFTTDLSNALRGVVFATITNAISDAVLAGATVTAVTDGGATVAPLESMYMADGVGGTFYRKYPGGVYDITISNVDGYNAVVESGVDVSVNQQSYSAKLPVAFLDSDGDGLEDADETGIYGTNPNLVDTDGDGLVDGAGGVVLVSSYPAGVDTDGDGYVDGEQDFGNDPTSDDYADGNIAPYGNPDTLLNVADYLVATRIVLGELPVTPQALGHIDMNADGGIDAGDLVLLLQAVQAVP